MPDGSLYLRNVFRSGVIPQDIFQHLNESYLWFIDLKQNNLIEIDGKIFQNLNHLNRLDVPHNSISILSYSGLHRLTNLNIDNNNLREVPNFVRKMVLL